MYEFWYYDTFTFMFYEHPLRSGIFKLFENKTYSNREFAAILQKQQPERFVMKIPGRRIDFPRFAADFRGKGGETRVKLFYGIPVASLYHKKK